MIGFGNEINLMGFEIIIIEDYIFPQMYMYETSCITMFLCFSMHAGKESILCPGV